MSSAASPGWTRIASWQFWMAEEEERLNWQSSMVPQPLLLMMAVVGRESMRHLGMLVE